MERVTINNCKGTVWFGYKFVFNNYYSNTGERWKSKTGTHNAIVVSVYYKGCVLDKPTLQLYISTSKTL